LTTLSRWQWVGAGLSLLLLWLGCCAATVVPGSPADLMQRALGVLLPVLALGTFWAAARSR
jgi:hypothetical protein